MRLVCDFILIRKEARLLQGSNKHTLLGNVVSGTIAEPAPAYFSRYGSCKNVSIKIAIFASFPGQIQGLGTRLTPRVCT